MYPYFKRALDLTAALLLCLVLSPLALIVALLIKLDSPGPVFYRQARLGLHQRPFSILKFRSMTIDEQRDTSQTFNNSPGVTRTGKLIRRCKIDELPQIINIVLGDMSFVGPRPSLPDLVEQIDPEYHRRYHVRPGLTGLAQTNGNVYIDWATRCQYDLEYIDNLSLLNDIKIVFKTVLVVLFGEDRFIRTR
jgi:lipopolysaccharide/colanic/teichoic acid biosynthesis glycosyltransferase